MMAIKVMAVATGVVAVVEVFGLDEVVGAKKCEYAWFDWVMFCDRPHVSYPDENLVLG